MKRFCDYSKFKRITSVANIPMLSHIKFCFSQIQEQEKVLEFSDSSDDKTITNPIIESLSQNETYHSISADPSSRKRHSRVDNTAWKRQNRTLTKQTDPFFRPDSMYATIKSAQSISEIHEQLQIFKEEFDSIKNSQKSHQKQSIMDILNNIAAADDSKSDTETSVSDNETYETLKKKKHALIGAYENAIKRCGFLREFDEGFKIFEDIKKMDSILNAPRIYGALIWLTMEKDFNEESLNKCFDLLKEMQDTFGKRPTAYVYAELIKAATALRKFRKAGELVDKIMIDDETTERYLQRSKMLRFSIINYYAKSNQIVKGLKLMNYIKQQYGSESLDDMVYSTMITGCAIGIKNGNKGMMEVAEKLFKQSFDVLGRVPVIEVFNSFLNCYSYVPDIESCIDLLETMKGNSNWPNPNGYSFSACLKAATQYYNEPLSYEQGWKYVNKILDVMDGNMNMGDYNAIYGLLFSLCGGQFCGQSDLQKLYKYYDEMEHKGIKLNPLSANSLLVAGVDHYKFESLNDVNNKEEIKKDVIKYIDWALLQFKKYNLSLTKHQNERLEHKLNEFM